MDGLTQRMQGASPDQESYSAMGDPALAPPAEPDAGAWTVDRVEIKPAANGGFIASCARTRPAGDRGGGGNGVSPSNDYENKDYAFSSLPEVLQFLQTELGGGGAPAPMGGVAMSMPTDRRRG